MARKHLLEKELEENLSGEVRFDQISRRVYSVDASICEVEPLGVVLPKDLRDLRHIVQLAKERKISLIPRGAATGIAGGCLGKGLVVDLSRHFTSIIEVNEQEEYVVCEPGVIQDDLNRALAKRGYRLGPDTSTGNRATLGGMLANNAAGARSLRFGAMVDHVVEVELLLSSGTLLRFGTLDDAGWHKKRTQTDEEGEIYRRLFRLKGEFAAEIAERLSPLSRCCSGYRLERLLRPSGGINVAELVAGSEGTLGIVTQMKLRICPILKKTGLCLIPFSDLLEAFSAVEQLLPLNPLSLEMVDRSIIERGKQAFSFRGTWTWLEEIPAALLAIEFEGEEEELNALLDGAKQICRTHALGAPPVLLLDPEKVEEFWSVRKAGLGLLMSQRSYSRALAFIEDISLPPAFLAPFMSDLLYYLEGLGMSMGVYGHVGAGCLHLRPYIDLRRSEERSQIKQVMKKVSSLLLHYSGAMSGEHGDGLVRSWLNEKMLGPRIYQACSTLKQMFDPENRMNPGKIVRGEELDSKIRSPVEETGTELFLNYEREGGFPLAVDLCNGNALCRKKEGVMCPSFHVTGEEFHTTRARATAFRSLVKEGKKGWSDPEMHRVLDLCVECKGCKGECPSQVNMAKFKTEFLYQYQRVHGTSLRSRLFGFLPDISRWLSRFPAAGRALSSTKVAQWLLEQLGVEAVRPLPEVAPRRFSHWFATQQFPRVHDRKVVLFLDTFTEFYAPEIGIAAVSLLHALGYDPIIPEWHCCGRTLLSKGFLPAAQKRAKIVFDKLYPYASCGIPIVGLEPSCLLTILDDYPSLLNNDPRCQIVEKQLVLLDTFLANQLVDGKFPLPLSFPRPIYVQGHCHQRSLIGMEDTFRLLRSAEGAEVRALPSGCCGLAGSFGYEKEHYSISMKMGEHTLFPALRAVPLEAEVVASGFSCRCQIAHGTQRRAKHLAEIVRDGCSLFFEAKRV